MLNHNQINASETYCHEFTLVVSFCLNQNRDNFPHSQLFGVTNGQYFNSYSNHVYCCKEKIKYIFNYIFFSKYQKTFRMYIK